MPTLFRFLVISLCFTFLSACSLSPSVRPSAWAQKVEGINVRAFYKVDNRLDRSALPSHKGMKSIEKLGIRSVLNVHHFGDDHAEMQGTSLKGKQIRIHVTKMTYAEIVESLRYIVKTEQPVLIHCLTGADRTGVIVAAYRMLKGWTKQAAIDEMLKGGFHFRRYLFPNLLPLVENIDIEQLRRDVSGSH
jgi:protein tyrosine phosphatase (PTP) superfamily phosphohydrolase (DUF442 family)